MSQAEAPPAAVKRKWPIWLRLFAVVGILLLLAVSYFILTPSPIDPLGYDPPPAPPLEGPWEPNDRLSRVELLAVGEIVGPEDVDVDDQGRIYGGAVDGRVMRIIDDGAVETFADTGGRPLGLAFDGAGNLIVADAQRGLLSIDPDGTITVLATSADGVPFGFCDDIAVAPDGKIYFSDASSKFGEHDYLLDMLEGRPHGRLLVYDPATSETRTLLDGLYFANGVAVSPQNDFVLVNETYRYRVTRYWLDGSKAGTAEIFIDNLPGFPDGISTGTQGRFWLALFTVRNPRADWLAPRPWGKGLLAKLPRALWPKPEPYGLVVALDRDGNVIESLHDPSGARYSPITSVEEHDGYLYLGSLTADRIGRYRLSEPASE